MISEERLLRIIGQLYAATLTPALWQEFLASMSNAVGARHAFLSAGRADAGGAFVETTFGIDPHDLMRSLAAQRHFDETGWPQPMLPEGRAFLRSELVSDTDYRRDEHYNEVVRPIGGFHGAALSSTKTGGGFLIGLCRPETDVGFDEPDRHVLDVVAPHLALALEIGRRLSRAEAGGRSPGLLDQIDGCVMLADGLGRELAANRRALDLIDAGDGLTLGRGGIAAATSQETAALRQALAEAAGDVANEIAPGRWPRRRLSLSRPSGRLPLQVELVSARLLGWPGLPGDAVVIWVREPDAKPAIDRFAVAETFRMTPRETDVAVLLAGGADPGTIARTLGLSRESVRIYLKRIFGKTGARSQVALAVLLGGFAARDGEPRAGRH